MKRMIFLSSIVMLSASLVGIGTGEFEANAQQDCGPPQPAPVEEGGTIQYCADGTLYTSPDGEQNFANSKSCTITDLDNPEYRAIASSC